MRVAPWKSGASAPRQMSQRMRASAPVVEFRGESKALPTQCQLIADNTAALPLLSPNT